MVYALILAPGFVPAQVRLAAAKGGPGKGHSVSAEGGPADHMVRYHPEGGDFVIVNGTRRFNRALYGTHTAFRVEAGDLPEFAFYMPGMGGNLHFELEGRPLIRSQYIKAIYRPGSMLYEIRDPALGAKGVLSMTVLALADAEGMIIRISGRNAGRHLGVVFGGASGKKFSRDGDIGADPESSFYLDSAGCRGDHYVVRGDGWSLEYGAGKKLEGIFPPGSGLRVDAVPALHGQLSLGDTCYLLIRNPASASASLPSYSELPAFFDSAETVRERLAGRVVLHTPDPWINTLGGALAVAADAIWEDPSYLHGAVAWRQRLPAWRGPYVADPLGWHDRARRHFSSYALSQLTEPATAPVVADTALHLARQLERLGTSLFSSGYICRNPGGDLRPHHYDMNLVFIDQLLTHFYWTGDTAYVRQMWPVLTRHLAWEKRNFDSDGDGLYDAYACIWASDALEYGGGGVTHSSAYNYRANKLAADLARVIGEDPAPYAAEAAHILNAINSRLWMTEKGWYAEYIDWAGGHGTPVLHPSAGLWTIYHAIDEGVADPVQAWESLKYIDRYIPHIPIRARGLGDTTLYLLSTTNWQPYTWSLNNVALAESLHTSLAYWQGGRPDEAFRIWKSALVESMYMGSSPGNFEQLSSYDVARGELYRDFGDGIGMAARSLVEGLFGISPDAIHDTLTIAPGFPGEWTKASLHIPDISVEFRRQGRTDEYHIFPNFPRHMNLRLRLHAQAETIRRVVVNGKPASWKKIVEEVGVPVMEVDVPPATEYHVSVSWGGGPAFGIGIALGGPRLRTYTGGSDLPAKGEHADTVSLTGYFNDDVTHIFQQQYLSPRPKSPTLQLPTQGIGNWCYPLVNADIDDAGLRASGGEVRLPGGIPFATPASGHNIVFTSLWDNYPDSVSVRLGGQAKHAWFLMAGSTNPMQSQITNGVIDVYYTDGTSDRLELVNPSNWWPIEEDYLEDGPAFTTGAPHPWRVYLKTGVVSNQPGKWTTIKGLTNTAIEGGAATVADMTLQPDKTLDHLVLRTTAHDVVVGLMSITLIKKNE
ncbi:MAG TPA: DUF4450 domain-containing protein [Puia sp.]|nr:DUF4450 domain-containing protein [Puia sp.]